MMNKKGSIKRVLLYILFFSILVFVIYSLFLTFKEISTKNKTKVNSDNSIKMLDENTTFNPIDFIYDYGIFGFTSSNFIGQNSAAYTTNVLMYESMVSTYFYANPNIPFSNNAYVDYYNYTSPYSPFTKSPTFFEFNDHNRLSISSDLLFKGFLNQNNIVIDRHNIMASSLIENFSTTRSFMIYYNCDISLENFAFTMNYNLPLSSSNTTIDFFVLTDVGGWVGRSAFTFNSSQHSFNFDSSNIVATLPNATKVIRFGFGVAQSYNSTNRTGYLPQYLSTDSNTTGFNYYDSFSYQNYYNSVVNNSGSNVALNLLSIEFSDVPVNPFYLNGYNTGYNDGINYNQGTINSLNSRINSLNDSISNLQTTINIQSEIITQLQNQLNQQQNNFKDLFFTFTDIPIKTIHDVLNFEFFGLNLFKFFTGVITALGAIWLIKKFL